jgi:hypothetical protein
MHAQAMNTTFANLPAIGQPLDAGTFYGVTTTPDGQHHAVVLLEEKPGERLTWKQAMNWADKVGGQLPSRPVAALLYANAKAQFEEDWHWTNEESSASCAWYCYFYDGYQLTNHESYEGCARAVRLIHLGV